MTNGRFSGRGWLLLIATAVLMLFANGRWGVAAVTWIAPALLVRYVRTQPLGRALAGGILVLSAANFVWWRGVFPLSGAAYAIASIVLGIVTLVPYLLDRRFAARLGGLPGTLVLPSAAVTIETLNSRPQSLWIVGIVRLFTGPGTSYCRSLFTHRPGRSRPFSYCGCPRIRRLRPRPSVATPSSRQRARRRVPLRDIRLQSAAAEGRRVAASDHAPHTFQRIPRSRRGPDRVMHEARQRPEALGSHRVQVGVIPQHAAEINAEDCSRASSVKHSRERRSWSGRKAQGWIVETPG